MRAIFLLLTILFFQSSASAFTDVDILVASELKRISLAGLNIEQIQPDQKKLFAGKRAVTITCEKRRFTKKDIKFFAEYKSQDKMIYWNKKRYWGSFKVYRRNNGSCDLINKLPMEKYIGLLLTKEVSSSWPINALKAQAIAARTYALYKINKNPSSHYYHMENSEKDQVYGHVHQINKNTVKAAHHTKGQILQASRGQIDPIFYHSKCGGRTLLPQDVWGGTIAAYRSVHCPFCRDHGRKNWRSHLSQKKLSSIISKQYPQFKQRLKKQSQYIGLKDQKFKRSLRLFTGNSFLSYPKPKLRKKLGRKILPSNNFKMSFYNDKITIRGSGYGHGVGLCQFGAYELAKRGYNYKQILSHYFPKYSIKTIN
jgi:stage II sporulation protein D